MNNIEDNVEKKQVYSGTYIYRIIHLLR